MITTLESYLTTLQRIDACVDIHLITPLQSAVVIPTEGNKSRGSVSPAVEGPNIRDPRGKAIMTDATNASSRGASHPRPSYGPAPSVRDFSGDAIHRDFFLLSPGPYYALYLEGGVFKDPVVCKTIVDQFPTLGEMVRIEALFNDQLTTKMSVLHCLMMSHSEELLAWYCGLLRSNHEYAQFADSRLKGLQERCVAFQGPDSEAKAKGKDHKKKIKSLSKNLDQLTAEVVHLSASLNQAIVLEVKRDAEILWLKASPFEFTSFFQGGFKSLVRKFLASDEFSRVQGELLSLAASAGFERGLSMHQTQEEFDVVLTKISHFVLGAQGRLAEASLLVAQTDYPFLKKISDHELSVTPVSSSLKLPSNDALFSSVAALGQNEEWVNAMVDMSEDGMVDHAVNESTEIFVQGVAHPVNENVAQTESSLAHVLKLAFSSPNDVVVALSVR
ncbi:hypothetical protein Tco_1530562 [Tanacetum coccineum]